MISPGGHGDCGPDTGRGSLLRFVAYMIDQAAAKRGSPT
jgi:hypothetical protein